MYVCMCSYTRIKQMHVSAHDAQAVATLYCQILNRKKGKHI
jgi:NADH:ubiquinone oxidoreductase subunit E